MLKIRRPLGRRIFNIGIAIPGKTVFLIETAPRASIRWDLDHTTLRTTGLTDLKSMRISLIFTSGCTLNWWKYFHTNPFPRTVDTLWKQLQFPIGFQNIGQRSNSFDLSALLFFNTWVIQLQNIPYHTCLMGQWVKVDKEFFQMWKYVLIKPKWPSIA